ncbi:GNAT family N-acetyltransferase [Maribacter halichondriae]|uniref:GNAT family N-acetyltransferase n=1 Tax=Maribacter halichondriae TaxID=2980554 RepID=UPI002358C579|nr:GNAT family N-acetyltransferase [Maribacter sp. Hal144]
MQLRLQEFSLDDLDELVEISKKTFVDAFERDNDPEDFNDYINYAFNKKKLRTELLNKDSDFYKVHCDAVLAGYIKLNQNDSQTDVNLSESIELERIYVLKDFQGRKIGQWMLDQVKGMAFARQKAFLWLGVWEKNEKAIAFYERNGFSKFGVHPYYIGKDKQMDWLMRYDL